MKRITLIVEMDWPQGVTITQIKEYVKDAVDSWGGQLEPPGSMDDPDGPGDPLFSDKHAKVKHVYHPVKEVKP